MVEQEIKQKTWGQLIVMCDQLGLDHTGDREALIAKLVEWEKTQPIEPEPVVEPPATEPEPEE